MDEVTVQVIGLRELDAKLDALAGKEAKRIVRAGLRAGGRVFQEAVRERAPERPNLPSGTAVPVGALRSDVIMRIGKNDDGLPAAIVDFGEFTVRIARWVEYGHRLVRGGRSRKVFRGPKGNRRWTGSYAGPGREVAQVPAHPFIRPAFEASADEAVLAFANKVKSEVEAAAAK